MLTHRVTNQAPPHVGRDAYADHVALVEAVERHGAGWADPQLHEVGVAAGDAAWVERGATANTSPPSLATHDRYGDRADVVTYHPAYHDLMAAGVGFGLAGAVWADGRPGAHVARAAATLVWTRVDAGHICPLSMTYAVIPSLRVHPELAGVWEPRVTSRVYDPSDAPADEKAGALFGMAMTEKQGGSDVRANTTTAEPVADGEYVLTGHKWFCSAPASDAFLMLAQAPGGLSCLLVPRWLPDATRNPIRLQRLKDKLGNRSNASAEIELDGVHGWLVGDEGRGVATIIEMVAHTRLDCVVGAAASMRHGLAEAAWHTAHRSAFGSPLSEQPLMRSVLADLALDSEAATALSLRLAAAVDAAHRGDQTEDLLRRIAMPVAKFWLCGRAPGHAAQALECLGGNGYVEDSGMPRLLRESPLNSIWEGSGNVQCLDVLRVLRRDPTALEALRAEMAAGRGSDARLDAALDDTDALIARADEASARHLVSRLAVTLVGSLLVRSAPAAVADAWCALRLETPSTTYGALPTSAQDVVGVLLGRAHPVL